MNFRAVKNVVTSSVARKLLIGKKHSPVMLFGTGIVGVVSSVVLASRATLKLDEVLKEAEQRNEQITEALTLGRKDYTNKDADKDRNLLRVKTAVKVCKLYAPAAAVGVLAIAALTGSHVILTRRNVGLTAAYATVDRAFRNYRERVVNEFGIEKDAEYRYGLVDTKIVEETEDGPVVKTVKGVDPDMKADGYMICFDEANPNWEPQKMRNQFFINACQNFANDKLNAQGHLTLNEVYELLGFPHTSVGAVTGWVLNNPRGGDNKVDFGIFRNDPTMGNAFASGNERSVWLDFNVDGIIWDLIGK